jgi:hypothetical protein
LDQLMDVLKELFMVTRISEDLNLEDGTLNVNELLQALEARHLITPDQYQELLNILD